MTKKKRMAAMTGIAGVSLWARKGQLEGEKEKREMSRYSKGSLGHRNTGLDRGYSKSHPYNLEYNLWRSSTL